MPEVGAGLGDGAGVEVNAQTGLDPQPHGGHHQHASAGSDVEHAAARTGKGPAAGGQQRLDPLQRQAGGGVAPGAERGAGLDHQHDILRLHGNPAARRAKHDPLTDPHRPVEGGLEKRVPILEGVHQLAGRQQLPDGLLH